MQNMILVSVVDNKVQISAKDRNVMTWIQDSLKNYKRAGDPLVGRVAVEQLLVDGFKDSNYAVQYASRVVRFLTSNGWREVPYNDYVCGHWYQKKL